MVKKIMGTKAGNYEDGILHTTRKQATAMARTLCGGISNQAKDQFYRDNDDVVIGVEWLDTLDGRTCPHCAGLSRKRWKTHDPHPVPPLHPNCRCVLIPVTEITDMGEDIPRPAANADFTALAKEEYEKKYPGKKWEDLAESTRKSKYYKAMKDFEDRTGKPAYSQVPGNMKFKDYFLQMDEKQKSSWLRKRKYAMWKEGLVDLDKFIPPYPDRAFTVRELKEMDLQGFNKGTVYQASGMRLGESVMVMPDGKTNFPKGGKYKKLKPYYDAAALSEDTFIKKLMKENPDREFAGVWDKNGELFCVAMGERNQVKFSYPSEEAVVIHNHPEGNTPSWADFSIFVSGKMKKMEIVTKNGGFSLTSGEKKGIVKYEEIKKRFRVIKGERLNITFEEWEQILYGSGYKIQNRNIR